MTNTALKWKVETTFIFGDTVTEYFITKESAMLYKKGLQKSVPGLIKKQRIAKVEAQTA